MPHPPLPHSASARRTPHSALRTPHSASTRRAPRAALSARGSALGSRLSALGLSTRPQHSASALGLGRRRVAPSDRRRHADTPSSRVSDQRRRNRAREVWCARTVHARRRFSAHPLHVEPRGRSRGGWMWGAPGSRVTETSSRPRKLRAAHPDFAAASNARERRRPDADPTSVHSRSRRERRFAVQPTTPDGLRRSQTLQAT